MLRATREQSAHKVFLGDLLSYLVYFDALYKCLGPMAFRGNRFSPLTAMCSAGDFCSGLF